MDSLSYRMSNGLMGNRQTHAVLEVTIPGPEIEFLDQMVIAITGGELRPLFTKEGTRAEHSRPEIC
jgi:allophanate hydrolase subunit 2